LKGHPVLLNRAPTLHRLGIQAFQPKLIEGKAIRLHPLYVQHLTPILMVTRWQFTYHLGNAAILEGTVVDACFSQYLNPANGAPIAVPSQDMVLGLYYITKGKNQQRLI
jgi:DNA-directed RNA polymerase subunit beta'